MNVKQELSAVDKFYIWLEEDKIRVEQEALMPRKKRGRKPTKKQYFNYINEQAIIAYNQESDQIKRNKVSIFLERPSHLGISIPDCFDTPSLYSCGQIIACLARKKHSKTAIL